MEEPKKEAKSGCFCCRRPVWLKILVSVVVALIIFLMGICFGLKMSRARGLGAYGSNFPSRAANGQMMRGRGNMTRGRGGNQAWGNGQNGGAPAAGNIPGNAAGNAATSTGQ